MAQSVLTRLDETVVPLEGRSSDHDELLDLIGDLPLVLIGEASHGTHEFYKTRAEITKRLIAEKGFAAVCIEGDWPDAYRINRYVRGADDDIDAKAALGGFTRFPTWMWRNTDVVEFVDWLRTYNDSKQRRWPKVGFYGLDLYSMYSSIDAVLDYLDRVDPKAAERARHYYGCLEPYEEHPEQYGLAAYANLSTSCRDDVTHALLDLQSKAATYERPDGRIAEDQYFFAEQNARVVANAERYYRAMIDDRISTWNLRDQHMVDTLERLLLHLARHQEPTKAVVWAHNSHVGNADATSMSFRDEVNIGSLLTRRHRSNVFSVGFTTHTGTVTAASDWHAPAERKNVRPSRPDSYEHVFHDTHVPEFFLPLRPAQKEGIDGLPERARERAIGVIYRPETELQSHYFVAQLIGQFDAIYHVDVTHAVEPLDRGSEWIAGEVPETYPTGE